MGVIMKNKVNYTGGGGSGSSTLADLEDVELTTPTDGQALVYDAENDLWVNGGVVGSGAEAGGMHVYEGAWTATASSSLGTTLTETLTLPAGYYIVVVQSPFSDSSPNIVNICLAFDGVADYTKGMATKWNHADFVAFTTVIHLIHQTAIKAVTGGSAGMNWSYLERGFIKAVRLANLQTALIYSEEEREVGVWTDGKPLYQKTIPVTISTSANYVDIQHGIVNIDRVIKSEGYIYYTGSQAGIERRFMPQLYYTAMGDMAVSVYMVSDTALRVIYGSWLKGLNQSTVEINITIYYTKTTDTAGSGIWTTTGEYAHHYSTDEKVVGTWTDKKPLYERTVKVAANSSGVVTLWTDSSVAIQEYNGKFIIRNNLATLSLWGRIADSTYKSALMGVGNNTTYGVYADIELGSSRTNKLDLELTIRYTKTTD